MRDKKATYYFDDKSGCSATEVEPVVEETSDYHFESLDPSVYAPVEGGMFRYIRAGSMVVGNENYLANGNAPQHKSGGGSEVNTKMTHEFHEGDKVRVIPDITACDYGFIREAMATLWGQIVTIGSITSTIHVVEDDGDWHWSKNQFELVSCVNDTMAMYNELTEAQKEHMDDDSQALFRVGVIGSSMTVSDSSKLLERLLRLNYKALADQARADIAKQEKKEAKEKGKV